jgi:uncharacterized protein (DUF58 family)
MAVSSTSLELTLRGRVLAWLAALAAGASWLGGDANARLAAAMLATPLLIDFLWKNRRVHRTEVRVAARRTTAGAPYNESITVVHRGRLPLRECLLVEPRTMRTEPPVLLPTLRTGVATRVQARQRSVHRSHVLERVFLLLSNWPLGMFRTRAVVRVDADLVTEPARVGLHAEIVRAIADTEAAPRDRSTLPGPEFHSLREHSPEEDARAVHALRSATLGTLVRRVTLGRMPRTVGIVLDLRRPPGRPLNQGGRRFEWSLGACASLLHLLRSRGAETRVLVLCSEPADLLVQGSARELELLTLLAEAGPSPHRAVPDETFATIRSLEFCYWIPAGGYLASPEFAAMPGRVTVIGGGEE